MEKRFQIFWVMVFLQNKINLLVKESRCFVRKKLEQFLLSVRRTAWTIYHTRIKWLIQKLIDSTLHRNQAKLQTVQFATAYDFKKIMILNATTLRKCSMMLPLNKLKYQGSNFQKASTTSCIQVAKLDSNIYQTSLWSVLGSESLYKDLLFISCMHLFSFKTLNVCH